MPRAEAALPGGPRLSDIMGVSLLAAAYPTDRVRQVLREMGADRQRERVLPPTLMVYYVTALAIYAQVSCAAIDGFIGSLGLTGVSAANTDVSGQPLAAFNSPANKVILYEDQFNAHDEQNNPSCEADLTAQASNMCTFVDGHAEFMKGSCLDQLIKTFLWPR